MQHEHVLHFQVIATAGAYVVSLAIDGEHVGSAPFDDSWRNAGETGAALARIQAGTASIGDLATVGSQLWAGLIAEDEESPIRPRVLALRKRQQTEDLHLILRIEAASGLDLLPWECVYDARRSNFVACDPQCAFVRHLPDTHDVPEAACRKAEGLRALIVVPGGSGLYVAHEMQQLRNVLRPFERFLVGGAPELLEGRVTFDLLKRKLEEDRFDIVHFIGHGWVDEDGRVWIRMNKGDGSEDWQPDVSFTGLFQRRGIQLVFLNCCHGAVPTTANAFAGLAPALLAMGVPAVFALRYEIPDDVATELSTEFYGTLFSRSHQGRIDIAAQAARKAMVAFIGSESKGARILATPVLFLAPGSTRLFELPQIPLSPAEQAVPPPRETALTPSLSPLVSELAAAVIARRVIPVLGPGLFSHSRDSESPSALALRGLIERLANESGYDREELEHAQHAGRWLDSALLQRVCQHYLAIKGRRAPLTQSLIDAYAAIPDPPNVISRIASWPFPGAICIHFDPMFERALSRLGKSVRRAYGVHQSLKGEPDWPILVHLRGSVHMHSSLVLTEHEHDRLWDHLANLPLETRSLVTGTIDQSLVFLGVSPRDIWVRRLIRQLIPADDRKDIGPIYFVWPDVTEADKSVWEEPFRPIWIDLPPEVVVEEVTRALTVVNEQKEAR